MLDHVFVKRSELLETVKANLVKHKADVKEALELRRVHIEKVLKAELKKLKNNETYQPSSSIHNQLPEDHSSDYEKVIRMLEMSTKNEIELTQQQFSQIVMDEWHWKHNLMQTSMGYGKQF